MREPRIYVPEDRDDLRDGLLKGWRDHAAVMFAILDAKTADNRAVTPNGAQPQKRADSKRGAA